MAESLEIWGGRPLYGTVEIPRAKNSVLPLLAASVLCRGRVSLLQVPALSDVGVSVQLLRALGCHVRQTGTSVHIRPAEAPVPQLPAGLMGRMRASVLFLAPVLARAGQVEASLPGGCRLGDRPIDLHLAGLEKMGAEVRWCGDRMQLSAPRGLTGTAFTLRCPSVGATETMLLAAVCAKGTTILHGAAQEPEIGDLAAFLNACGGRVRCCGGGKIEIQGVPALTGCRYTPIPDRITAATVACACAAAGGKVTMTGVTGETFAPVLDVLETAGCTVARRQNSVTVERRGRLHGVGLVETGGYPGFPTDAAPLVAAALLTADGKSCIRDTIFTRRFACAAGFAAMGGAVQTVGPALEISPAARLHGTAVCAQDLRGGAALVIAALAAAGKTRINDIFYLKRGYCDVKKLFMPLGAVIDVKKS